MSREPKYNSSAEEAIAQMEQSLSDMRSYVGRPELVDVNSDVAFELGYETAIHDAKRFTGPDPVELGVIVFTDTSEEGAPQ